MQIEHGVVLARALISIGLSKMPRWLDGARNVLDHRMARMKTVKELEEEMRLLQVSTLSVVLSARLLGQ